MTFAFLKIPWIPTSEFIYVSEKYNTAIPFQVILN